jgi:starch-binding outer membrane protein, SusD/RagB family
MEEMMKRWIYAAAMAIISIWVFTSCEDFLDPEQELNIEEEKLFNDWYEYRAVEMGMYALQQKLVEQLVVLGELRADLLTITDNADPDLIGINNFDFSKDNKYTSPTNLFKLISASNNFIRILERERPEVLDKDSPINNYDRLYGEALCMRAWAYFTAVRIYGKVPFIHQSLVTYEEIIEYVNSPGEYTDSVYIDFSTDGYYNDTVENKVITLEKKFFDTKMVIDHFTHQLENEVKAIGVNHHLDNNDKSWDLSIWNIFAFHALMGQMYLTDGNYVKAIEHFEKIMYTQSANYRYQLDYSYAYMNWPSIFTTMDEREHILVRGFNKSFYQQNQLQDMFDNRPPNRYMLKPTKAAVDKWETVWRNADIEYNKSNPTKSKINFAGEPGDLFRGIISTYGYYRNQEFITANDFFRMLELRRGGDLRNSQVIMEGVDTVVIKYSLSKDQFDKDANFIIYRAAAIHLYAAEIYTYWASDHKRNEGSDEIGTDIREAQNIVSNGSNFSSKDDREQLGVRGRIGLGPIDIKDDYYIHDPYTNRVVGYRNLQGQLYEKQKLIEEAILDERARELAYEGERFYDLMRVAKRRNDPSFLAEKVSAKFPAGKREEIYNLLLDEKNWYIPMFE